MALRMSSSNQREKLGSRSDETRGAVLDILRHCYFREKQHAMRYRQHAERMRYSEFRGALVSIASEEEKHAAWIGAKMKDLGEKVPDVIPIRVAKEPNSWYYLRTDLEDEQRCAGELQDDLAMLRGEFPNIAELLECIEHDCRRHRAQLRDMRGPSDPQSAGPA